MFTKGWRAVCWGASGWGRRGGGVGVGGLGVGGDEVGGGAAGWARVRLQNGGRPRLESRDEFTGLCWHISG